LVRRNMSIFYIISIVFVVAVAGSWLATKLPMELPEDADEFESWSKR
jgi:hypothetical protein